MNLPNDKIGAIKLEGRLLYPKEEEGMTEFGSRLKGYGHGGVSRGTAVCLARAPAVT